MNILLMCLIIIYVVIMIYFVLVKGFNIVPEFVLSNDAQLIYFLPNSKQHNFLYKMVFIVPLYIFCHSISVSILLFRILKNEQQFVIKVLLSYAKLQ